MADSNWAEIYKELGATPVINAIGSVTMPELKIDVSVFESAMP